MAEFSQTVLGELLQSDETMNLCSMLSKSIGILALTILSFYANPVVAEDGGFWQHWSDGKAEVNAYRISQKRYNELRDGTVFLIYVTEPFSKGRQIKVDYYDSKNADHTIALKLNIVEQFQTGVYDYRLMTSHFFDAANGLTPLKAVFSSQEWCGTAYEQINWRPKAPSISVKSYFEGESLDTTLPKDSRLIDGLFVYGRGLLMGGPANATAFANRWIESAKQRRLSHRTAQRYKAKPKFGAPKKVYTSLGAVEGRPLSFKRASGATCVIDFEMNAPYRVLGWQCTDGETATLVGSMRTAYWEQTKGSDAALLKRLGVRKP